MKARGGPGRKASEASVRDEEPNRFVSLMGHDAVASRRRPRDLPTCRPDASLGLFFVCHLIRASFAVGSVRLCDGRAMHHKGIEVDRGEERVLIKSV